MALPTLSPEQRSANLAKARQVRQARAALLASVKSGEQTVPGLLTAPTPDPVLAKIPVERLLGAVPGVGPARVAALMERSGIPTNRRVGGLGQRQRASLLTELG